jgi:hypothetical protein
MFLAAPAIPLLLTLSCLEFSPPTEESVGVKFLPGGAAEVTVEITLADPRSSFQDEPKAKARLEEAQWEALNAKDPWARRFSRIDWARETFSWEKQGGNAVRVRRVGRIDESAKLAEVFRDLPLSVKVRRGESSGELAIVPQDPSGGTAEQRQALETFMDGWLPAVQGYLKAEADLYRYLEEHPERVRPAFGEIFKECLGEEEFGAAVDPPKEEAALMEALGEAVGKVTDAIEFHRDDTYSADELSRLFYDPMPAPLTVETPGPVVETEGFEKAGETSVRYRGTSIWRSLGTLSERWVSPDILTRVTPCLIAKTPDVSPRLRLDEVLSRPRRFALPPSVEELRKAFDEALKPAPVYRVAWVEVPAEPPTPAPASKQGAAHKNR